MDILKDEELKSVSGGVGNDKSGTPVINEGKCIGCGICKCVCTMNAITSHLKPCL